MIGDMPSITDASHSHTTYTGTNFTAGNTVVGNAVGSWVGGGAAGVPGQSGIATGGVAARMPPLAPALQQALLQRKQEPTMTARRLVQVFIADPDENVPLDKSMIYSGSQHLTDATDQELYFEIDIKNLVDAHNVERVKLIDKSVKERTEYLEPVKIRDLKMVVTTIATF